MASVNGLTYLPRQATSSNGNIACYAISVRTDGAAWNGPVTTGMWGDDKLRKDAVFAAVSARYVRLAAMPEAGNRGSWSSAAEIDLIGGAVAPPALPRSGWTATASGHLIRGIVGT
jgi:galactose oxidase